MNQPEKLGKWRSLMAEQKESSQSAAAFCGKDYGHTCHERVNFDSGTPAALFQANPREMIATSEQFDYDVSKDGQRFSINTQLKTGLTPMSVVMNWTASLSK